ncbi:hypothetical protein DL240_18130 [Lujinxingia litoralis]|uniref:Uncharacterized protein n=1 Tax=Lujinxingia litoralis TaxID=2211119 RepID=A0A328C3I8_9DELT|nr:barstar family protein [Lujinxingia litoralis]RAL20297.1 hypothetical protein DL240_18130 [Lujinxingia litoralis]
MPKELLPVVTEVHIGLTITIPHLIRYRMIGGVVVNSRLYLASSSVAFIRSGERRLNIQAEYGMPNIVCRKLRGEKCKTLAGFMVEIGAALQFFDDFGENGNALRSV